MRFGFTAVRPPDAALWHNPALPLKLGCTRCPDLGICGGLRIEAPVFDCRSLCSCTQTGRCIGVCRSNAVTFIRRVREVGGFGFENVPRHAALPFRLDAGYVPIIYDGTSRRGRFDGGIVALPLLSLFNRISGGERFAKRAELVSHYKLAPRTRIILTGVAADATIEGWWGLRNRPRLIESLKALGILFVTAPNYSLFTNVTRHDNLHNLKRIMLAWSEFMAAGMPCALHINGRTERDYERLGDFVSTRDEVSYLAFEFLTGTASLQRGATHCESLVRLAAQARRPLHLILRGGRRYLPQLNAAFASVTFLDAEPYMKTIKRFRARPALGGEVEWIDSPSKKGERLDALLQHNVEIARQSDALRRAWIRADYGHGKSGDAGPLLQPRPA
jgi:hypothetical protein